jgi:hypothetical protein
LSYWALAVEVRWHKGALGAESKSWNCDFGVLGRADETIFAQAMCAMKLEERCNTGPETSKT